GDAARVAPPRPGAGGACGPGVLGRRARRRSAVLAGDRGQRSGPRPLRRGRLRAGLRLPLPRAGRRDRHALRAATGRLAKSARTLLTGAPCSCYDDLFTPRAHGGPGRYALWLARVSLGPSSPAPWGQEGRVLAIVQVKDLIEAGVHFGHRASRW